MLAIRKGGMCSPAFSAALRFLEAFLLAVISYYVNARSMIKAGTMLAAWPKPELCSQHGKSRNYARGMAQTGTFLNARPPALFIPGQSLPSFSACSPEGLFSSVPARPSLRSPGMYRSAPAGYVCPQCTRHWGYDAGQKYGPAPSP